MLKYTYCLYSELTNNYELKQNSSSTQGHTEFFTHRPLQQPKEFIQKTKLSAIEEKYSRQSAEKLIKTNKDFESKFRNQLQKLKKYRGDSKEKTYLYQIEETGDPSFVNRRQSFDTKIVQRLKMREIPLCVNRILQQRKNINNEISFRIYNRLEEQRGKSKNKIQDKQYSGIFENPESPRKMPTRQNIPFISSGKTENYINSLSKIQKKINYQLSKTHVNKL